MNYKSMFGLGLIVPVTIGSSLLMTRGPVPAALPRIPGVDVTPPQVSLRIFGDEHVPPEALFVLVTAADSNPISSVQISVDGRIVAGRLGPPYDFTILPNLNVVAPPTVQENDPRPQEICALAADKSGNSTTQCETVDMPPSIACTDLEDCPAQSFCEKPAGDCGGLGTCSIPDLLCHPFCVEVCGCDGNTYCNECQAESAGVNIAHYSACP